MDRLKTFATPALNSPPKPPTTTMRPFLFVLCALQISVIPSALAFAPQLLPSTRAIHAQARVQAALGRNLLSLRMAGNEDADPATKTNPEKVVEKYGLEAGLFSAFKNKDKSGPDAKELLKKYGSAYLLTSISLSLVSFGVCYLLVSQGIDVASLLSKVGIETSSKTEAVGTFALAYAAHKAASPIRFPPTVALTPVIAKRLFNKEAAEVGEE